MRRRLVAGELEPDQPHPRAVLAADEGVAADELLVALERDGEADAGLERIDLVVELVVGEDQAGLDAQHVERLEAERRQAARRALPPDRVPDAERVLGMAEDLVAELAGIAGARHDDRRPVEVADAPDREVEPGELGEARLRRRRPDHLLEDGAALWPLHRDVVQLVGRGFDPGLEAALGRQVAQPFAVIFIAADQPEIVRPQPEHRAIVEHPAGRIAHRGIDHLPHRQLADVAGAGGLQQGLGVGAQHLELAQGRQVGHRRGLAAGMVFGDGAVIAVPAGQPEAAIVDEAAGGRGGARVEGGLAGQHRFGIGSHAEGDRFREVVAGVVDADMDVGRRPAVGRVDVVGTGRRGADQIGHGAHQHIVARSRPGLVEEDLVLRVHPGVEEEVDRRPALARRDRVARQRAVEVLRAADMAGIAHVVVVLGGAGELEGVVPADRVAHHLDQRLHVGVEELRGEAGAGIGEAEQRARRRGVEAALEAALQLAGVEGEEVRALPPGDVDDLDELALGDLVGHRGGAVDPPLGAHVGERLGQRRRRRRGDHRPPDGDGDLRRRVLGVHRHRPAGGMDHHNDGPLGAKLHGLPGPAVMLEQRHRALDLPRQSAAAERRAGGAGRLVGACKQPVDSGRRTAGLETECSRVLPAVWREHRQLAALASLTIGDGDTVAGRERQHHRAAAGNPIPLGPGLE